MNSSGNSSIVVFSTQSTKEQKKKSGPTSHTTQSTKSKIGKGDQKGKD